MTEPVDVSLRPRADSSRSLFQPRDSPPFVGSPVAITNTRHGHGSIPDTPPTRHETLTSTSSFSRPSLTTRTSGVRTPPDSRSRHPEQPWSLFGQLMENEGHLPPSPASTHRRISYRGTPNYASNEDGNSATGSSTRRMSFNADLLSSFPSRIGGEPLAPHRVDESAVEYDSADSASIDESIDEPPPILNAKKQSWYSRMLYQQFSSPISRNILKCSIAYFIGALFTFSPLLSQFISDLDTSGPSASGHMVATMSV